MIGAALADLHLGFQQFSATEGGRNAREQDVERAWLEAVRQVVEAKPDLVTIAGDIFHHLKITDYARLAFLRGLQTILDGTSAVIIILQGNHEAARTVASLTPIALASVLRGRVHVVTDPKRIRFCIAPKNAGAWVHPDECEAHVSVACFPFTARADDGAAHLLERDPEADVNILAMHAAVRGSAEGDTLPRFYGSDRALAIGRVASEWDAVCVGDYHEFTRLHPTALAFYSGSIERTSSDIWKEGAPKGWVLYDTKARTMRFMEVPTRRMLDYRFDELYAFLYGPNPPATAEGLNDLLGRMPDELAGAIVRLKVDGVPRDQKDQIDRDLVRRLKGVCLHFQLDVTYTRPEAAEVHDRREGGLTLAGEAARFDWGSDEVRALAFRFLAIESEVGEAVCV